MLLRFRVANFMSLRDEQELSFVVDQYGAPDARDAGVTIDGKAVQVHTVAGVYGANAAGKSNLLRAMEFMRSAVLDSHAEWAKGEGVPRKPFAFDPVHANEPSFFEIDVVLGNPPVHYTYGFSLSDRRVESEWLYAYPGTRRHTRQVLFNRDTSARVPFEFPGENLKGPKATLAKLTRENALFLSTAAANNQQQLGALQRWFADNFWLVTPERGRKARENYSRRQMLGRFKSRIEGLLQHADMGIEGIEAIPRDPDPPEIRFVHRTGTERVTLDFADESLGTRTWFAMLGPILLSLSQGAVLLVDELDASLHPAISAEVIRLFNDPEANSENAQLVFTSHDTALFGYLPGGRPLDRAQVWLTEKNDDGATDLYPLTAAKPRPDENLYRGYHEGRYGAKPQFSPGELAWWIRLEKAAEGEN
ncbi:AAA family ATPase [Nonomuraea basaltis]|uniref:AAA family ATPase n=1 Tax=Nonomuraea basaltis TaxID=2495887 RepID=UPI00110C709E|nr:ATP-binding protein [Nonomuraea basaltis]TMR94751.1 ATP-binding protein [Nonomuraea basaltis]